MGSSFALFMATASLALIGVVAVPSSALAYFPGKTLVDGAELKQQPRPDAPTVKKLPAGTGFNAADKPTNGYYYIRTATDLGWVSGAAIGKPSTPQQNNQAPRTAQQTSPQQRKPQNPQQRRQLRKAKPQNKDPYMVKAHLDYNMFKNSQLNSATQSTTFQNAVGWGAEFMYFFNPLTAVGLRIDSISQDVSATVNPASGSSYTMDFKLSTFAVMVGAERILLHDTDFYLAGIGYLGLASSSLTETADDGSTKYSAKPITLLALLEGGYKLSSMFSLYGELGYRVLSSSNVTASETSPLSDIVGGPVNLSFSGPVIGAGISARF